MTRAGGSLGLLLLSLLLLDGELGCQGAILQLHVRQRVLDVHQAGSLRSLELQCCRSLGLETQLVAQLVSQLGIAVIDEAVQDHPQHHHGDCPEERMIDTFTRWAPSMWGDRMWSPLISPARPKPCGGVGDAAFVVHYCPLFPLLSIFVHCCALLSIVIHCY